VERVEQSRATGWVAWVFFAVLLLVLLGSVHLGVGLVGLVQPQMLAGTRAGLALPISLTAVAGLHVALGVADWVAGVGLLRGLRWARVATIVLACLGAIVNFLFIANDPAWSAIALALTGVIVYAVVVHGHEVAEAYGNGQ
jgi:hypothetical protein